MSGVESGSYVPYEDFEAPSLQALIDSGAAWQLEGSMGRAASEALEAGDVMLADRPYRDYWGNLVPAWWMVEPGTKGSPEYAGYDRADFEAPSLAEQKARCAVVGVEVR